MKKKLLFIINYLISGLLLYVLFTQFDIGSILSGAARADIRFIAAAAGISILFRLVFMPYIWGKVLSYSGVQAKFGDLAVSNAVSLPLKFLLPFKISELVRAAGLKLVSSGSFPVALSSTVLLRLVIFASTALLFCLGAALKGYLYIGIAGIAGLAAVLYVVFKLADKAESGFLKDAAHCFRSVSKKDFAKLIIFGTVFQAGELICAFLMFAALGISIGIANLVFYVSLMIIATNLPVSIQGLGIRETVAVLSFSALPNETALLFGALQSGVYHILPAAAGALVWLGSFAARSFSVSIGREVLE
ncbi:MAG: lysylphosphatidylglycerol synthase domain-containing protein [Elusimicrobiota bacterium]